MTSRVTSPGATRTPGHVWLMLGLILAGAAVLRLRVFHGFGGLDDAEYTRFAWLMSEGQPFPAGYEGPAVFPLRVGLIAPAALMFRLLGVSDVSVALYPLLVSLAAVVVIYLCAAEFFGPWAGLVAAGLLAIFGIDLDNATVLLPDLPGAFFAMAGITVIAMLAKRPRATPVLLAGGLAAGLAFGVSWLTKESVWYLAPFCLALLVWTFRRQGRSMVWLWAGFGVASLSILVGESLIHYARTGDLMFRMHEVERNYRQWENGFFTAGSDFGWAPGTSYADAVRQRLFVSGPRMILFDAATHYLPLVGVIATVYGWRRRDAAFLVPGIWLWSLVLMFNFGSSSTSSYVPLALFYRYMYPLYFAAMILTGGLLARTVFDPREPDPAGPPPLAWRAVAAVSLLAVLAAAAPNLYYSVRVPPSWWTAEAKTLARTVTPETVVYGDALSLRAMEFYSGYPGRTAWQDLTTVAAVEDVAPNSVVVVNTAYVAWLDRNAGMWVRWPGAGETNPEGYRPAPFFKTPPSSWTPMLATINARAYRVPPTSAAAAQPSSSN